MTDVPQPIDAPAELPEDLTLEIAEMQGKLGREDTSLLALVDRLTALLERSDLAEIEVQAGGTGLVLRKPSMARQCWRTRSRHFCRCGSGRASR